MSSEDQQLLARISQLAGQINRHKNQLAGVSSVPAPQYPITTTTTTTYHHATPSTRPSPYQRPAFAPRGAPAGVRGRGYGGSYRVKKVTPFRNRTLVLNGAGASDSGSESASKPDNAGPSWVSRTDRHMQLINSDVYEKESQARAKAIEQTRLQKQKQRDHHERSKLRSHFSHLARSGATTAPRAVAASSSLQSTYQVVVEGIPFYIAKNGSKLVKVPGDPNPPSATPKTAIIGGVKFYRSKNGNLYRHGVVKAQRRTGNIKKIDELCKTFSTTGSCSKGPRCRYIHDAAKVAACKDFLLKGDCPHGNDCDLSHDLTPERTPFCLHYAKGNCTNSNCPYTHSQVSAGALVCRPFGLYGYCDQGADCTERHVLFECPDFSNTGVCKIKGCKLPHRERASFMRRANVIDSLHNDTNNANSSSNSNSNSNSNSSNMDGATYDDPSSDDDSVNSDDVDSDEVEEFVGTDEDADGDLDFVTQKDYIGF